MNWDQVEGKRKQVTGSAQKRWGNFTSNDIQTPAGKKDPLVAKIRKRYGIAREEAEKQADTWSHALTDSAGESAHPVS
jgi:uncharacterized protein YjbJ (UPF0337 family)